MFICLRSDKDPLTNGNNTPAHFTSPLPENYNLDTGRRGAWCIGLHDIHLPPLKEGKPYDCLYVLCSACETSCMGDIYRPLLATINYREVKRNNFVRFPSVTFIPLRNQGLSEITISVCDQNGVPLQELNSIDQTSQTTKCTLLLKWIANLSPWRP